MEKWKTKWSGLVIQAESHETEGSFNNKSVFPLELYKYLFDKGIKDLLSNQYLNLVDKDEKPFVINCQNGINYLFANKYYEAKLIIEDKFQKLFNPTSIINGKIITNKDIEKITILKDKKKSFKLNDSVSD